MINIRELIDDPDFCQPGGVNFTRTKVTVQDHEEIEEREHFNVPGIITIAQELSSEMMEYADINKEHIHVFTWNKLIPTGSQEEFGNDEKYIADVVHWQNKHYKVLQCLDDTQYGFCRSTCEAVEQEVV